MHTHQKSSDTVATIGLDIGKNTFHLVGLEQARRASPCASRSHATSLSAGLSICPPAFSASRQALARITSRARFNHSATTFA